MHLNAADLHFVLNDTANRLVGWNADHQSVWEVECRNHTVANGQYGHNGNCPRGEFLLGLPERRDEVAFGAWFTPIGDYGAHHAMADWGRAAIGVHGGGSDLPHPLAPAQGWEETRGCLRLQNSANAQFVHLIRQAHAAGGCCYLTVGGDN